MDTITRDDWDAAFARLRAFAETMARWPESAPDLEATRCIQSRHRTLAHLRACQEQWQLAVRAFLERDQPRVTLLHPWRQFEAGNYATLPWRDHWDRFFADRAWWQSLQNTADWNRGGQWNRKPDTVGGLTLRLANHEAFHIAQLGD